MSLYKGETLRGAGGVCEYQEGKGGEERGGEVRRREERRGEECVCGYIGRFRGSRPAYKSIQECFAWAVRRPHQTHTHTHT